MGALVNRVKEKKMLMIGTGGAYEKVKRGKMNMRWEVEHEMLSVRALVCPPLFMLALVLLCAWDNILLSTLLPPRVICSHVFYLIKIVSLPQHDL